MAVSSGGLAGVLSFDPDRDPARLPAAYKLLTSCLGNPARLISLCFAFLRAGCQEMAVMCAWPRVFSERLLAADE
jgi:hypothetical protein